MTTSGSSTATASKPSRSFSGEDDAVSIAILPADNRSDPALLEALRKRFPQGHFSQTGIDAGLAAAKRATGERKAIVVISEATVPPEVEAALRDATVRSMS